MKNRHYSGEDAEKQEQMDSFITSYHKDESFGRA